MNKATLTYIALLLVLCAASYWCGTRHRVIEEGIKVEIDSTVVVDPPPIEVKPTKIVVERLPIDYSKLKDQILDSLIAAGYILDTVNIVDFPNILPDSLEVKIPMSQSIFKDDQFEIAVTGYKPTLDYAKIFNKTVTTTLRSPRSWNLNVSLGSFTVRDNTELSLGLNAEYSINNWVFSGGYQVGFNGKGGAVLGVQYNLL